MAFCNDGDAITGIERATKAEAINDCKEAFLGNPSGSYYIERYTEMEGLSVIEDLQILEMSMSKQGKVQCKRKEDVQ